MSTRDLSYIVKSLAVDATANFRPHAVAICARCQRVKELKLPSAQHNPEEVAKLYRKDGWDFSLHNAREVVCPQCQARRAQQRRGDSPKGVVIPMQQPATSSAAPPNKTSLTVAERERARTILDGTFDAAKGFYVGDYSDAKVAAEMAVPTKLVTDYREVAFGPLKSVPELDTLLVEWRKLKERTEVLLVESQTVASDHFALGKRIDETLTRLGIKHG
jgi:hypothetical protein